MKKRIRLTESQLYRVIREAVEDELQGGGQVMNDETDDDSPTEEQLQALANAYIGRTVNCGGDETHGGRNYQVADAKWMSMTEANNTYSLGTKGGPRFYISDYMQPRLINRNEPVLVLFDDKKRCITWVPYWKALSVYERDPNGDSILRVY